jgi:polysaccharide pyruvyl transferase WcaK-like protein
MRLAAVVALSVVSLAQAFDFSHLLNRIQQETIKFDQRADDVKNREEEQIHRIELQERDLDRSLEAAREKYHWVHQPISLLERKHRVIRRVKPRVFTPKDDMHVIEQTERQREEAQKEFLAVEKMVADLPSKLLGKREKLKEKLEVPLEDSDAEADDE